MYYYFPSPAASQPTCIYFTNISDIDLPSAKFLDFSDNGIMITPKFDYVV